MKWSIGWSATALLLGLMLSGCGGGGDEDVAPVGEADVAGEAAGEAAGAEPGGPGMAPRPGREFAGGRGNAEAEAESAVPGEAVAAAPAEPAAIAPPPRGGGATDELLQIAQAGPGGPEAAQDAGAGVPGGPGAAMAPYGPGAGPAGPGAPSNMQTGMMRPPGLGTGPPPGAQPSSGADPSQFAAEFYGRRGGGPPGAGPPGAGPGPGFEAAPGGEPGGLAEGSGAFPGFGGEATGGLGGAAAAAPDFSDPFKGAQTFLAAVQSKDKERISEAVALRSAREAAPKHQKIFRSILDRSIEAETIDQMATLFDKMQIVGRNDARSTAEIGIIVGKTDEKGSQINVTLTMRREKAGWKVSDFLTRVMKAPGIPGANNGAGKAVGSDY